MANTYFLDAEHGNDDASGQSPAEAWRTLARAMGQRLQPGDALLLKRGCAWEGSLRLRGSGEMGRPITLGTCASSLKRSRLSSARRTSAPRIRVCPHYPGRISTSWRVPPPWATASDWRTWTSAISTACPWGKRALSISGPRCENRGRGRKAMAAVGKGAEDRCRN